MSRADRRDSWIHKIPAHCHTHGKHLSVEVRTIGRISGPFGTDMNTWKVGLGAEVLGHIELRMNAVSNPTDVGNVLFDLLADKDDTVSVKRFWNGIKSTGLRMSDPRLKESRELFDEIIKEQNVGEGQDVKVDKETFLDCVSANMFIISKAFKNEMVIPEFHEFVKDISDIHYKCKLNTNGKPANYIPQLARADTRIWALSICTIDGQRHSIGETTEPFCLQSCCKPLNYALAISDLGSDYVHKWVGQEPSGRSFNELTLDDNMKPHNPMINSGAIVTVSLLKPDLSMADRFEYVSKQYKRLAGGDFIGFSNSTYLSERETADRNFALGYYMRENKCFPEGTNLHQTLEFYFQLCSVECNTDAGAVIAATLANGGICPTTGERVLVGDAVRNTMSLMYSCGMYDYSGQFAFKVGLPAKSGVSGAILIVVPNVMGICCWSPALDSLGNSCRGVQLCQELVSIFNFHNYDDLQHTEKKKDPRKRKVENDANSVVNLLFGAANGDVSAIRRFALSGIDLTASDYDGRTALHLAAAEGHLPVVRLLLEKCKVPYDTKDRWGYQPVADAKRFGHQEVADYLEQYARSQAASGSPGSVFGLPGSLSHPPIQALTPIPQRPEAGQSDEEHADNDRSGADDARGAKCAEVVEGVEDHGETYECLGQEADPHIVSNRPDTSVVAGAQAQLEALTVSLES